MSHQDIRDAGAEIPSSGLSVTSSENEESNDHRHLDSDSSTESSTYAKQHRSRTTGSKTKTSEHGSVNRSVKGGSIFSGSQKGSLESKGGIGRQHYQKNSKRTGGKYSSGPPQPPPSTNSYHRTPNVQQHQFVDSDQIAVDPRRHSLTELDLDRINRGGSPFYGPVGGGRGAGGGSSHYATTGVVGGSGSAGGGGLLQIEHGGGTARSIRSSNYARPHAIPALPAPPGMEMVTGTEAEARKRVQKNKSQRIYKVKAFGWLERGMRQALWGLGQGIVKLPALFLMVPFLVFALSMIGLVVEKDNLTLWPRFDSYVSSRDLSSADRYASSSSLSIGGFRRGGNSPGMLDSDGGDGLVDSDGGLLHHTSHSAFVHPSFNSTNPKYDALHRTDPRDFAVLLKTDKGTTVLREEVMDSYFGIKEAMSRAQVTEDGDKVYKYSTLCRDRRDSCRRGVVDLIMNNGLKVDLTYPETYLNEEDGNVTKVYLGSTFGGVETDPDGAIARARSLAMYFKLKESTLPSIVEGWDKSFRDILNGFAPVESINITHWSYGTFVNKVKETFTTIHGNMGYSILILMIVSALGACTPNHYRSKPMFGLAVGLVIVMSCIGGLSIRLGSTSVLNPTAFPLYYTITSMALLLSFSMLQSWRKFSNANIHPREKLMFILSWDSPLLIFTSTIIVLSFGITGAVATLPYFKDLCLTVTAGVFLFLVFGLCFGSVCLYLTGYRESAGLKWFYSWKKGDTHFPLPLTKDYDEKNIHRLHAKLIDLQPSPSRTAGSILSKVHVRYMALLTFAVYMIFGVWGCSIAPLQLREDDFLPVGSSPEKFLRDYRQYYGRTERYMELTFEDTIDYMSDDTRLAILDMLDWAQEEQFATRVTSWLKDFIRFEQASIYLVNRDTFVPVVHLIFLTTEPYGQYSADIAFDQYQAQIVKSRMYLQLSHKGITEHLDLVNGLLARAAEHGLPLRVKMPSVFSLEHDLGLHSALLLVFITPMLIIAALSFVLFAQPFVSVLVLLTMLSVLMGTIGYSSLWGVPLNALTVGSALLGIVHSAATSLMVMYHFSNSGNRRSARSRMEYALQSSLWPMLVAGAGPILAFLPLLASNTPMVTYAGKILFLCICLSSVHGLLFLPATLMLLAHHLPHCCSLMRELCEETCCVCCDSEEDATSIYYIPTTGRSVDPDMIHRFFGTGQRRGGTGNRSIHQHQLTYPAAVEDESHYALPPPPRMEMIMPPPPRNDGRPQPDLVGYAHSERGGDTGPRYSRPSSVISGRLRASREDVRGSMNRAISSDRASNHGGRGDLPPSSLSRRSSSHSPNRDHHAEVVGNDSVDRRSQISVGVHHHHDNNNNKHHRPARRSSYAGAGAPGGRKDLHDRVGGEDNGGGNGSNWSENNSESGIDDRGSESQSVYVMQQQEKAAAEARHHQDMRQMPRHFRRGGGGGAGADPRSRQYSSARWVRETGPAPPHIPFPGYGMDDGMVPPPSAAAAGGPPPSRHDWRRMMMEEAGRLGGPPQPRRGYGGGPPLPPVPPPPPGPYDPPPPPGPYPPPPYEMPPPPTFRGGRPPAARASMRGAPW